MKFTDFLNRILIALFLFLSPSSTACLNLQEHSVVSITFLISLAALILQFAATEQEIFRNNSIELVRTGVFIGARIGEKIASGKAQSDITSASVKIWDSLDEVTVTHDGKNLSLLLGHEINFDEEDDWSLRNNRS